MALPIRATITLWAQLEIRAVDAAKAVVSSRGRRVHLAGFCGLTAGISHGLSGAPSGKANRSKPKQRTKRPHGASGPTHQPLLVTSPRFWKLGSRKPSLSLGEAAAASQAPA
ncbi:uncharacterized protein TrAtP1_003590 [Trichoderma atroviride]|uniref:uncharacterized protein n=1 Tax=Hypocrea atroviridis TaxID=63577 RepID=UPI00331796A2|nr:hypothetical protein TrAtP1_003590 [Trichoderma atroviride]